jgi:class 3 adenylate cyclase
LQVTICPNCGQENPPSARFCNACATPLPARVHGLDEERKVVTVLFADLVGFTARAERLDPEDVRAILTPYFARVRSEIEACGGTVEKFIGDAVMGVFGAPLAHGDDPERAVRAAVAIRDAVEELNASDPNLDLQLRIAVNTGEVLVSLAASGGEGLVAGDVVNTASRLQEAAPVNGILVGEETYRATRSVIQYEEAEPVVAKGKQQPVRVWRAVAAPSPPGERTPATAPMLGRESELAALLGIWARVVAERRPQLVTLFGPAGIGKTRLATEFADLAEQADARVVRGRSLPYGEVTPYGAFAAQVKQVAGMFDTDAVETASDKLERTVRTLIDGEAEEIASHIAMLIGVGTEGGVGDRQTLFFSARRLVEALAAERPTVLVFEDIHVSASSMLDLLETLASRVRDVPLLLLTQARPELLAERPTWGGGLPAYTALQLDPLGGEQSKELARRLLELAGADAGPASDLADTAEGNPLFIEELAVSVVERSASAGELPSSVRSIVAARLDALPPVERDALLDAAVVGKVFWSGALARMAHDEGARLAALDSLEGRDLIRRDPVSRLQGQQQFAFKHQLIYEVAYATLPRALRRERHAVVAGFLEEAVTEAGDVAPALAQHWREAGESERAIAYLLAGAEQANRGWAKEEAFRLYGEALELIPEDDRERRREVTKQLAVVAQAAYHVIDAQRLGRQAQGTPGDS